MRLTCPNCGAQYEVPEAVIPPEGRDVQCSNCGNTWFQAHPDHAAGDTGGQAEAEAEAPAQAPRSEPEPGQEMDPEVARILREEAEREARLRASESAEPLESQPDLGLDSIPAEEPPQDQPAGEEIDETARRAREASERMARIRGEPPAAENPAQAEPTDADSADSRRDLLPDIEDINASLRGDSEASARNAVSTVRADARPARRAGFARGFSLVLIVGVILALVYINAARISQAVPQADPVLASYVGLVDQARLWLDTQLNQVLPAPE